ncbi:enoyl-CoA hydratase/isomerase family protein [Sulfobacillus harzensis]|uniref:Enoyl-CoA hydratase n=1 Tax=Sulfobacillus harzensis TaxID=2729629 RepID=A0A7Y0Q2U2_9FIRM|nr:enoyl-CoA hydratase [Sulfobacillus harzensis]NMP23523.1 enoyl-CoA hydratase [Sulfobacillus harzensis]
MADLLQHREGPLLELALNRPERLNAFSEAMLEGLLDGLALASREPAIRAVVIKGSGRAFSAGGDVNAMGEARPQDVYQHIGFLNQVILAMIQLPKPIIAAVHGYAAGAGFNLALAADLIVASETAHFAMSFAQVGLISDGGGLHFLPRLVGPHVAKEIFFLAEPITAARAHELGIVNRVVPDHELSEATTALAGKLAQAPALALRETKRLIHLAPHLSLEEMLERERLTQMLLASSADHREGVQAFKEKRRPVFHEREV